MNEVIFPAHIRKSDDRNIHQTVEEHCLNVAKYSSINAEDIAMDQTCYLAGLFHDIGKFTEDFKEYICKVSNSEKVIRGSVNHTFAGVRYIINSYCKQASNPDEKLAAELIAYAIGAHHGLFDIVDENGKHGFEHRLTKEIDYDKTINNAKIFLLNGNEDIIKSSFLKAVSEAKKKFADIHKLANTPSEGMFYLALLARMILSAVIDADRRDTAEFMENKSRDTECSKDFWAMNKAFFEAQFSKAFPMAETAINKARSIISDMCQIAAGKPVGIYRLNIPTGAGKTLASLRYALHHADIYKKKRIIYVMPLLSIIEQNATVIKSFVANKDDVLEHHSNVINEDDAEFKENQDILMENWVSPIIITTLVQFLNTLFSHRTSSIRRMHGLANSIIIFDEVQTVPPKMLTLFNLACNFLSNICGATIILCSATQPCFEKAEHPMQASVQDLININADILAPFKRVKLVDKGLMDIDELGNFALKIVQNIDSLLVVCNTKTEAQKLFRNLQAEAAPDIEILHISAGMCKAHRSDLIENLRELLTKSTLEHQKIICVSTQVIEAGIDISFMSVIRLRAGMDSVVQSAGRCNRNGEIEGTALTYIVELKDEKLNNLRDIKDGKVAMCSVLENKESFTNLLSDEAIRYYYKKLYDNMKENYQDFYIHDKGTSIFDLLSRNKNAKECETADKYLLRQAFKEAGEAFEVFEDNTYDVIVPYGKGADIISGLYSQEAKYNIAYAKRLVKDATQYDVSIFRYQLEKLQEQNGLIFFEDLGIYTVNPEFYDKDVGIVTEPIAQKAFFL